MNRSLAAILITLMLCSTVSAQAGAKNSKSAGMRKTAAERNGKSAGDVDEIERLLDKCVLAQGGIALSLVKTRIIRGAVEVSFSPAPGTFEAYEKMPTKSLLVINAPSGQFIQASDGGKRWVKSPWGGVTTAGSVGGDFLSRGSGKGFKWRSLFSSAYLKGRAVVERRPAVVLAATPIGRDPVVMYFDAETGLLLKQEFLRPGAKKGQVGAVFIDGYATVDGMKVPAVLRYVSEDVTMTFRVYEVKHNVPIDDALFRDPSRK